MNNQKSFSVGKSLLFLAIIGIIGFAAWYVWETKDTTEQNLDNSSSTQVEPNSDAKAQTQEEAINEAKAYKPEGICATVMTPAVHNATGATYSFPSSCLAPGWERIKP